MSAETKKKKKKESRFLSTLSRLKKNKMAMAGLIIVCLILLMALFAPLIAPYGYEEQDLAHMFSSPSSDHWMGTDNLGRDIFSRLVYGSRQSLKIGFLSVLMASVIGITLGAIAGYYGGKVDNILMRFLDVFQSVPAMLMSIAIAATTRLSPSGSARFPSTPE